MFAVDIGSNVVVVAVPVVAEPVVSAVSHGVAGGHVHPLELLVGAAVDCVVTVGAGVVTIVSVVKTIPVMELRLLSSVARKRSRT